MLSYTGIAPFPDRQVACGQLSTPAARDSSLPSRAVATFPSSALNSAFTSAFIYSITPDALMISVKYVALNRLTLTVLLLRFLVRQ